MKQLDLTRRVVVFMLLVTTGLIVVWPLIAVAMSFLGNVSSPESGMSMTAAIFTTMRWALGIAVGAALIGWCAGDALERRLRCQRGRLALACTLAPLAVPGYALFWCWWQVVSPGSTFGGWVFEAAADREQLHSLRHVVLWVAMVSWSWPLVALPIAFGRRAIDTSTLQLAALDGVNWFGRFRLRARSDAVCLAIGALLVVAQVLASTVSFDLAQVQTIGFELRALEAMGMPVNELLLRAAPTIAIALGVMLAAVGLWWQYRRKTNVRCSGSSIRYAQSNSAAGWWLAPIVLVTIVPPTLLLWGATRELNASLYWSLHAGPTLRTLVGALVEGVAAMMLAGFALWLWSTGSRCVRLVLLCITSAWCAVAILPVAIWSAALATAMNTSLMGPYVYDSGAALLLGQFARVGTVALCLAIALAQRESRAVASLRQLAPGRTFADSIRAIAPSLRTAMLGAGLFGVVYSIGEIVLAARLSPPGASRIAASLLNGMHYQRPDTVALALAGIVGVGWFAAGIVGVLIPKRFLVTTALLAFAVVLVPGCDARPSETIDDGRLPKTVSFGAPGRANGLFEFPRAIAVDVTRNRFFVVDKGSRIQRFSLDGEFETSWLMPDRTEGKPVGMSVAPDGRLYVADTHYHRVLVFDPDGRELARFGRFGTNPGEFVYPTDIAFTPTGEVFISEYGTNDRIQIFDSSGVVLRQIGSFGRDVGQFARPQSLALDATRGELFVADACNHRIDVFSLDGEMLRTLAGPGTAPGGLSYPYGLDRLPDGSLIVSEIGAHRVQRLDASTGESLGVWGGEGFTAGRLKTPWAVGVSDKFLFVVDSGNGRILRAPIASLHSKLSAQP